MNNNKSKTNIWVGMLVITVLGIGAYTMFNRSSQPANTAQTANQIENPAFAPPKLPGYFKKVSNDPVSLENKPYFLYVGAQFCPFCAAERWSLVKALSNFGTWSGLGPDTSAEGVDGFDGLPTYSFLSAKYESQYIAFGHKEVADKKGRPIPGQELTDFEAKWFNQYDPRGGVPFLFLNGQYAQLAAGYSPALLSGKTFAEVKRDVDSNTATPLVAAINEEATILTAYLCKSTNNQPTDVCTKPDIAALASQVQ